MNGVGENIRILRKEQGLSLNQLAHQSKVSKAYLSQLENGASDRPSAEMLYNIAVTLGTSIGVLLGKKIIPSEQKGDIPKSLAQAAVDFGIPENDVQRLAGLSMREGKKKGDYSKDDWRYLYDTLKRLDRK